MNTQEQMEEINQQEQEVVFTKFDSFDAWTAGEYLKNRATKENRSIAFHISLNRRDLFHFSMPTASGENDWWIRRKENAVYLTGHASFLLEQQMIQKDNRDFVSYTGLQEPFTQKGGGFPILLRGTGCVGAIVVSGMQSFEDHAFGVDALRYVLQQQKKEK